MDNENKVGQIEREDAENEGANSENEGVENEVLPPELKGYILLNHTTTK